MNPDDCTCPACAALEAEYGSDPELLRFYRRKLLVRGWATFKTAAERSYILAHAPWAQANAEKLRHARAHLSNMAPQTAICAETTHGACVPETPAGGGKLPRLLETQP